MRALRWSVKALLDFDEAQGWIARESPLAAQTVADRIWQASQRLRNTPRAGRPGIEPGTREWVVQRTPYLIVYRVGDDAVEVLRVWHGRRDWMAPEG